MMFVVRLNNINNLDGTCHDQVESKQQCVHRIYILTTGYNIMTPKGKSETPLSQMSLAILFARTNQVNLDTRVGKKQKREIQFQG